MTYELAKQLKDAGFPQFGIGGYSIGVGEIEICKRKGKKISDYIAENNVPYLPTLSELIAACGKRFKQLYGDPNHQTGEMEYTTDSIYDERIWYQTPEEAVAKLWLALNKH